MKTLARSIFVLLAVVACVSVYAQDATPDVAIVKTINDAILRASGSLFPQAVLWLGSLMGIQFILTNFTLLKSGGDIEAVFGKLIGSIAWFGFCYYVLNNGPALIESVGNAILNKFTPNIPTPTSILTATLGLASLLLGGIVVLGTSIVGVGNSSVGSVLVIFFFGALGIGLYMAIKILLLYIELALIVALAPLSFSLLGLNALRDQGIAPFKSLISLIYRIVLLGIICTAFKQVSDDAIVAITALSWANPFNWGANTKVILYALAAFPILAFFVYNSDTIAASLAGGGSSLGTGDVASAAAAGAALGAMAGSAGGSTAGLASQLPQSMSAVIGNMMGSGGGSMSNASGTGSGGAAPATKPPDAVASLGSPSGKPPTPQFPTNNAGAPQPSDSGLRQAAPAQSPSDAKAANDLEEKNKSEAPGRSDSASGPPDDRRDQQSRGSFGQHASNLGNHLAQEKATTSISISPHQE